MRLQLNKVLKLFDHQIKGVHQVALLLGIMGILTKVSALFRDRLLASAFGAGPELDVYFAAFRIPDFIFSLTLFMTASASLIPIFLEEMSKNEKNAHFFLSGILTSFLIFIFVLTLIIFMFIPSLIRVIAPGFDENQLSTLVILTRIMLFSPLFLGLSNIISIVIQSFQKFFIYALSPLFYNFGIIIGITVFYPFYGIKGLAWGVVIGAFFHLAIQIPSFIKLKFFPKLTLAIFTPSIKNAYLLGFTRTLGLSFNQVIFIVFTAIASFFSAGSISIFNFSNNIQSIPLSVVGVSYTVAAFPVLSRLFIRNDRKEFLVYVSLALRHIIFWSLPISVLFLVLRAQIVRSVLGAGAFGWTDTRLTAASLAIFSVSITAQSIILLLSRAYYAAHKTLKPIIINVLSSVFIILIALIFIWFLRRSGEFQIFFSNLFRVGDISDIQILFLAFAFSFGSIINALLLLKYFVKDFGLPDEFISRSLRQNILASLIIGFTAYGGLRVFGAFLNTNTFLGIFFQGFLAGALGVLAGFIILYFLKNKELSDVLSSLKTKFWRAPVIAEETETLV